MYSLFAIFVLSLTTFSVTEGYLQELILHESEFENGTVHIFRSEVSNFTYFPSENIKRWCVRGLLTAYPEINFMAHPPRSSIIFWGGDVHECHNTSWFFPSFRFMRSEETGEDVVSLFSEEQLLGPEFRITRSPYGGIEIPVKSCGYSGKSSWRVYEGKNFDGKSSCLQAQPDLVGFWGSFINLNVTTIRSLVKGCDNEF